MNKEKIIKIDNYFVKESKSSKYINIFNKIFLNSNNYTSQSLDIKYQIDNQKFNFLIKNFQKNNFLNIDFDNTINSEFKTDYLKLVNKINNFKNQYEQKVQKIQPFILSKDLYVFEKDYTDLILNFSSKNLTEFFINSSTEIDKLNIEIDYFFKKYKLNMEINYNYQDYDYSYAKYINKTSSIMIKKLKIEKPSLTPAEEDFLKFLGDKKLSDFLFDKENLNFSNKIIISHFFENEKDFFLGNRGNLVDNLNKSLIFTDINIAKQYIKRVYSDQNYGNLNNWNFLEFDLSFNQILQNNNCEKSNLISSYLAIKDKNSIENSLNQNNKDHEIKTFKKNKL